MCKGEGAGGKENEDFTTKRMMLKSAGNEIFLHYNYYFSPRIDTNPRIIWPLFIISVR
jgi:hypothetical protein